MGSFMEKIWALLCSSCSLLGAQICSVPQIWSKSVENSQVWFQFTFSERTKSNYPKTSCSSDSGFSEVLAEASSDQKVKKKSTNKKPVRPSHAPTFITSFFPFSLHHLCPNLFCDPHFRQFLFFCQLLYYGE